MCRERKKWEVWFSSRCTIYFSSGEEDDDVEVKQTQVSSYKSMQITAILQKNPVDTDVDSSASQDTGKSCRDVCSGWESRESTLGLSPLGFQRLTAVVNAAIVFK